MDLSPSKNEDQKPALIMLYNGLPGSCVEYVFMEVVVRETRLYDRKVIPIHVPAKVVAEIDAAIEKETKRGPVAAVARPR